MTTNLEYCNYYSERGWRVFLCGNDKKPLVKAWQNEATTDKAKITEWWGGNPNGSIGLATGKLSGIFAIDVDAGHGGFDTLAQLDPLPDTVISNTGGGGKHYLFNYPNMEVRNSASKVGPGIDCRAEGGYIIVPHSSHPSGQFYEWDKQHLPSQTKIADAPDWLLHLLIDDRQQIVTTSSDGAYISGQRNNALTSLAGAMRRRNMSVDAIFVALNVENINRCVPPLLEAEVRAIAASVSRYDAQAALPLSNKDRAQAEWSFVRCVYEWPNSANEFQDIRASDFSQKELGDFWQSVNSGIDVTVAAANSSILAEIEKYTDYIHGHMEGYAKQIKHYSYHAGIMKYADTLKHHALAGNTFGVEKAITEINKIPAQTASRDISIGDVADDLERRIIERAKDPTDVWGIPYAWDGISKLTGGKHAGELILDAAEPGIGKSWWWLQDALETALLDIPVKYWSGEMRREQLVQRLYQLLGVNGQAMKTGRMSEENWDKLRDAKALIMNSPLYLDDRPLHLNEVRPMLIKEIAEHGLKQGIFDYESLITAPGKDETEQSANTSRELKNLTQDLNISIILISSVNKGGMDTSAEYASKANVRGSGQKLHDADIVYMMTKFDKNYALDYGIMPNQYDRTVLKKIKKGRELVGIENGFIVYQREDNSPRFKEIMKPEKRR